VVGVTGSSVAVKKKKEKEKVREPGRHLYRPEYLMPRFCLVSKDGNLAMIGLKIKGSDIYGWPNIIICSLVRDG
jgi:hypothetical protein